MSMHPRKYRALVAYPRVYRALVSAGHDAAKAFEIMLDARRGDRHALNWIRCIVRLGRGK